jgi:hypothetical protein
VKWLGIAIAALLVGGCVWAYLRLARDPRRDRAELSAFLDRLENILRRDSYRDDIVEEYRAALESHGWLLQEAERERRKEFLRSVELPGDPPQLP